MIHAGRRRRSRQFPLPVDELAQRRRRARRGEPGRGAAAPAAVLGPRGAGRRRPALRGRPGAGPGEVLVGWHATLEDEVEWVADVVAKHWRAGRATGGMPAVDAPTAAVLCRVRSQFPLVEAALRARGSCRSRWWVSAACCTCRRWPSFVAALEVLHDPTRGDSLVRLLAGPAVRLGPRDLEALNVWVAGAGAPLGQAARRGPPGDGAPAVVGRGARRAAALRLGGSRRAAALRGRQSRLERLGRILRDLRARTGLALPDLVAEVERALLLDVEVPPRPGVAAGHRPRAPRRVRRRRGRLLRGGRRRQPGRLPRVARRGRRAGARPRAPGAGRGRRRRGPGAHRARGQGPGVGRRRRPRAGRGRLPDRQRARAGLGLGRLARAALGALPYPLRGDTARPAALGCRGGAQPGRPRRLVRGVQGAGP